MWDKEGRGGELLVLPGEPELVATIPRQGVEVGEEGGLLHVLPQERVKGGKGGPVPVVDVSRRAHFKTVHCAFVVCDICEKWCVCWGQISPNGQIQIMPNSELLYRVVFLTGPPKK